MTISCFNLSVYVVTFFLFSIVQDEIEKCSDDVDTMVRQGLAQQQSDKDNLVLSPSAVTSTPRRLRDSNHR